MVIAISTKPQSGMLSTYVMLLTYTMPLMLVMLSAT
jgi:hypothetical protein